MLLKKYFIIGNLLFLFITLCSCRFVKDADKTECNNLLLVYMAGDNSLNKAIYSDLEEIKNGLIKDGDIVLVLADRYTGDFYSDDWDEARLIELSIENGNLVEKELSSDEIGVTEEWLDDEIDSGSKECLTAFLQYASSNYMANHIYLDLWNHGGGWKSGDSYHGAERNICYDEETGNSLSLLEFSESISSSKIKHFDVVIVDACTMASVEFSSAIMGYTDTVIFSQDSIPEDGMPYNIIVPYLFDDYLSVDEKCCSICEAFCKSYENKSTTISAVRIDENKAFQCFENNFSKYITQPDNLEEVKSNRPVYYEFMPNVVDMSVFTETSEMMSALYDSVVICNYSNYSTGFSIYFPEYFNYDKDCWEYTDAKLKFLRDCPEYLDFLKNYTSDEKLKENTDLYEPNGHFQDAYKITFRDNLSTQIEAKLWCSYDDDWYLISESRNIKKIQLFFPETYDYSMVVYLLKDGEKTKTLNEIKISETEKEIPFPRYDYDSLYIKVYSTFGFYNQNENYILKIN